MQHVERHEKRILRVTELKRELGIDRPIERPIEDGSLPHLRVGRWRYVSRADALEWLEGQRVRPTRHAESRVAEVLDRERRGAAE